MKGLPVLLRFKIPILLSSYFNVENWKSFFLFFYEDFINTNQNGNKNKTS
jgi:hypothetical protein